MRKISIKIILEGTVKELQNTIRLFGMPEEVIVDGGTQTDCHDLSVGFLSNDKDKAVNEFIKGPANRNRQTRRQLHSSSQQP